MDPLFEPPGAEPQPTFQQGPFFQPRNTPFQPSQQGFPFQQSPFQQPRPVPQPANYGPRPSFQMYRSASSMNLRPGSQTPQAPDMCGGQYGPFFQPQFFPPMQIPTPGPSSPAPTFPTGAQNFPANPTPMPSQPPLYPFQQPIPQMYYYQSPSNGPPFQVPTPVQSPPPMEYYNLPTGDYFSQRAPPGWGQPLPPQYASSPRPSRLRRRSSAGEIRPYPAPMYNTMYNTIPQPAWNPNQIPVWNVTSQPAPPAPPAPPPAPPIPNVNVNANGTGGRKASTSGRSAQQKGWFTRFFSS